MERRWRVLNGITSAIGSPIDIGKQNYRKRLSLLARSEGFEPPTPRFEVWCSIQLSYEREMAGAMRAQ
jgi:hypothetical protein